jgi:hypothetical protein
MGVQMHPGQLCWQDVDPRRHSFKDESAYDIAYKLIPGSRPSSFKGNPFSPSWETSITHALVREYGTWACGWRWARDEGSIGGGPVASWCCPSDSWTTREETAKRVQASLRDWRCWIEKLCSRFETIGPNSTTPDSDVLDSSFQKAVVILVTDVVEQTTAGDAWYTHCEQVLSWFLEFHGFEVKRARNVVRSAIAGRFESWSGPDDELLDDVAQKIGATVA